MRKRLQIFFTEKEYQTLEANARNSGFAIKGEYIRYILFTDLSIKNKIDEIYKKVMKIDV